MVIPMTHKQHFDFYVASCEKDGGIYECRYSGGKAGILSVTHLDRPMYMITDGEKMHVILREYFDKSHSAIVSLDIENGKLTNCSDAISTEGVVACHLCKLDGAIYAVNYLSGSITKPGYKTVTHSGSGPNRKRQDMPHTHYIESFDGKYLLSTDLGTDEIYVYDKDLNEISRAKVPEGHGARHLAYAGGYVYCANELKSTVSVFEYSDGRLNIKNTIGTLPSDFKGESTVAAIRIKDGYVYVSNRGHDSISVMKIEGDSLRLVTTVPCGGESPRDFDIFGNLLICTNETSGNVTFFEIKNSIPLRLEAELKIKSALCVCKK